MSRRGGEGSFFAASFLVLEYYGELDRAGKRGHRLALNYCMLLRVDRFNRIMILVVIIAMS